MSNKANSLSGKNTKFTSDLQKSCWGIDFTMTLCSQKLRNINKNVEEYLVENQNEELYSKNSLEYRKKMSTISK